MHVASGPPSNGSTRAHELPGKETANHEAPKAPPSSLTKLSDVYHKFLCHLQYFMNNLVAYTDVFRTNNHGDITGTPWTNTQAKPISIMDNICLIESTPNIITKRIKRINGTLSASD